MGVMALTFLLALSPTQHMEVISKKKKQLSPQRKNKASYLLGSLHAIAAARRIVIGFCVRRKALAAVGRLFSGVPVRFGGART